MGGEREKMRFEADYLPLLLQGGEGRGVEANYFHRLKFQISQAS